MGKAGGWGKIKAAASSRKLTFIAYIRVIALVIESLFSSFVFFLYTCSCLKYVTTTIRPDQKRSPVRKTNSHVF